MSRFDGATFVTSFPSTTMRPASGRSKPATSRKAVVLPQPEGPSSERNSPWPSSTWMPFSAFTGPKLRCRSWSSRYAISALSSRAAEDPARAAALAADEEQREHRAPGEAEAHQRERGGGIRLRLVYVLQEEREGVERGQVGDRELAQDHRQREEGSAQRRRADVRQDHLEERRHPVRTETLRRLRQRVHVDR